MRHHTKRRAGVAAGLAGALLLMVAPAASADHDVAADLADGAPVTFHLNDSGYGGEFDLDFDIAYEGDADGREVYVLAPMGWESSATDFVPGISQGWDPTADWDESDQDPELAENGTPQDAVPALKGATP